MRRAPAPLRQHPMKRPSRAVLSVLTASGALGVANLYYGQPMAAAVAHDLMTTERNVGVALTLCQIGYGAGMLVLVPLGDGHERRSLASLTALASSLVLVVLAFAKTFWLFAALMLVLGAASSLPQIVLPIAVSLAEPAARGRIIGTIMGGMLAGILLSRTVSGLVSEAFGHRTMFLLASCAMATVALVLRLSLPRLEPAERIGVRTILGSMRSLLAREDAVRKHGILGGLGFASFSVFWATLAFHLNGLGHGPRVAGLYGVLGLSGVVVAPIVGRLASRLAPERLNIASLSLVILGFAAFAVMPSSLAMLGVGVVLLDAGVQANHITNQNVILGLSPEHRNRFNALYMVMYFAGGALGSLVASLAWPRFGWAGTCAIGAFFAAAGVLIASRRRSGATAQ
ncbi:MAG: Major facilitator superfamily 1 transporter [Labilithrix sp.]|nr:Major facilitator superfamily 1 transporter [Labilithrix sp.]